MCYLNNICFVCLCNKDNLSAVYNKETQNDIFLHVKYALPELTISDSEFPVYICYSCQTTLCSFYAFKKNCLENFTRLKHYLKTFQTPDNIISEINCDQPIKQEHQLNNELNTKQQNEDPLLPAAQVFTEIQVIKHEPEVHIISNVQDENEVGSDQKTATEVNIEVKDESLASEDSADRELYHHFVKCETVYDDEEDGIAKVTSSQNYQCTMCDQVFSDKLVFNTHTSIHIKKIQGLECSICDKKFTENISLKIHMRYHLGIKDYECTICNERFREKVGLSKHMKTHEGDLECSICKKKFSQKWNLKRHMKYHLGIKDFECAICRKKFTESGGLNKHMMMHEGITDLECDICKTKFTQSCKLKKHMKYHSGDTDFVCTICNKNFTTRYTLNLHMKMHEGIKDYECLICKKKFSQNKYYKIHMKLHSGVKDFECTFCNKKFLYNHTLKRHVNINHFQNL